MLQNNRKKDILFRYTVDISSFDAVLLTHLSSELYGKKMMLYAARMCYSALAYKQAGSMDAEHLRQLALDSCDQLEKHIWYIRMSFGLFGSENTRSEATVSDKDKFSRNSQTSSDNLSDGIAPGDVDSLFDGL